MNNKWKPDISLNSSNRDAVSRRDALRQLSLLASAASQLSGTPTRAPSVPFPKEARLRLAVASFPFQAFIDSTGNSNDGKGSRLIDIREFPALVADRFGVRNIEPHAVHLSSTDPAYLDSFRLAVDEAKSQVVNLGLGSGYFYDADAKRRKAAINDGKRGIEIAVVIGSPSVRQHLTGAKDVTPDVVLASDSLRELGLTTPFLNSLGGCP